MTDALVLLALLAFLAWREYAHDQERRALLDRIQAPDVARAQAMDNLMGPDDHVNPSEEQRIRRKAEEMGLSVDQLRTPTGWGNMGW